MATDINKYQTKEVLNRVLNTGEDALKVDIDNVTLTTEGADVAIDVALDNANDSVLVYSNTSKDGSGTNYTPLLDSDGHLQVDTLSSALPSGAATAANQTTIIGHVDGLEALLTGIDSDTDAIKTDAAAIEVLLTAANVDHAANEVLLTGIDADTNAIKTAVELLDNAVDGNYLNVNANIAGTDFVGGAGAVAGGVQRVTLASDDPAVVDLAAIEVLLTGIDADTDAIKTAVEILDDWDDSNYANVNINLAGTDAPTGGGVESGALRVTIANDSTGVLSVDDGGGTLTVDGTVDLGSTATTHLSEIEGAVETIEGAVSGSEMQVDIVADGAGLATAANQSTTNTHLSNMLYGTGLVVTAVHGGSNQALGSTYQSLYVGVGGDVVVTLATSGSDFTFKNVASGQLLPIQITDVKATNTTATNMIAMKA